MKFIDSIPVPSGQFSTDACTDGGGGYYCTDWFYVNWHANAPNIAKAHINVKELYTVGLAAERWAPYWANSHIVVHTDNITTMAAINKGTTRCAHMMPILRRLFWLSAVHNFYLTARYIKGVDNIVSDSLSRLHCPSHLQRACSWFPRDCFVVNDLCCFDMFGHTPYASFAYLQEMYTRTSPPCFRRQPHTRHQLLPTVPRELIPL